MEEMLDMLKVDLGITTTAYDERLLMYLQAAVSAIEREGATLSMSDVGDLSLAVMYAAWLWRRRDRMDGMPRMLRYQLNNRVFAEKAVAE